MLTADQPCRDPKLMGHHSAAAASGQREQWEPQWAAEGGKGVSPGYQAGALHGSALLGVLSQYGDAWGSQAAAAICHSPWLQEALCHLLYLSPSPDVASDRC